MHMQLAQVFDSAKSRALNGPRKDEMHVDGVAADAVHAGEAHGRHDRDAGLRRCELVWAALRDQRHEAPEEVAADVGLTLEELLDRVDATGVGQIPCNQFRAATRA